MTDQRISVALKPPSPIAKGLLSLWHLDPNVAFLNHGSFGATPRKVLDAQTKWRERFEAQPIEMLDRQGGELLSQARQAVGKFVGSRGDDLAFVANTTCGINAVLRSIEIKQGDELLTTNHVYNGVRQTFRYIAGCTGAKYIELDIPIPIHSEEQIVNAIAEAMTDRTRILVIDHITSDTAIIFPVKRIVDLCHKNNVEVLVDGAHAPGMIDLDISELAPTYYAANLHKWVCAPKGSAFLWVTPERQNQIHPNTISHFLNEGFVEEFKWQATRDITAWLSVPDAIEYLADIGWQRIKQHNHQLATWAQAMLSERWDVPATTPLDGSMLGSMVSLPLPASAKAYKEPRQFMHHLFVEHKIEIPVNDWQGQWLIRPSCQIYNQASEYERLADAVITLCNQSGR